MPYQNQLSFPYWGWPYLLRVYFVAAKRRSTVAQSSASGAMADPTSRSSDGLTKA
jgi:hypothetical protein